MKMYPIALETEMNAMQFWEMTVFEIREHIKAYSKRYKDDMREKVVHMYNQAILTASMIGKLFSDKVQVPHLHEMYPTLFEAPKPQENKQDWRIMKARIEQYAAEMKLHKEMQKRGDVDGDNS